MDLKQQFIQVWSVHHSIFLFFASFSSRSSSGSSIFLIFLEYPWFYFRMTRLPLFGTRRILWIEVRFGCHVHTDVSTMKFFHCYSWIRVHIFFLLFFLEQTIIHHWINGVNLHHLISGYYFIKFTSSTGPAYFNRSLSFYFMSLIFKLIGNTAHWTSNPTIFFSLAEPL